MGLSSDRDTNNKCTCENIPKITNINYNTGKMTFFCELHHEKEININDFFKKDRHYKNSTKITIEEMIINDGKEEEIELIKKKEIFFKILLNFLIY